MKNTQYEELGKDPNWIPNLLFAGIFIQENMLHTVFDRYNEISSKQWLLMTTLNAFESPPDMTEIAHAMGCSRQNVKKLAQKLDSDGYITLEKHPEDARSLCVKLTEKGKHFQKDMAKIADSVHSALFQEFSPKEITLYYDLSVKLMHGIGHLEDFFRDKEHI